MLYPKSDRATLTASALFIVSFRLLQLRVDASEYLVNDWGPENGLPDDFETSLAQTPDGYLWIGTYNGLGNRETRASTIAGRRAIQSEQGKGTRIARVICAQPKAGGGRAN
jgi:ligand-binding sensor domain-containing protein